MQFPSAEVSLPLEIIKCEIVEKWVDESVPILRQVNKYLRDAWPIQPPIQRNTNLLRFGNKYLERFGSSRKLEGGEPAFLNQIKLFNENNLRIFAETIGRYELNNIFEFYFDDVFSESLFLQKIHNFKFERSRYGIRVFRSFIYILLKNCIKYGNNKLLSAVLKKYKTLRLSQKNIGDFDKRFDKGLKSAYETTKTSVQAIIGKYAIKYGNLKAIDILMNEGLAICTIQSFKDLPVHLAAEIFLNKTKKRGEGYNNIYRWCKAAAIQRISTLDLNEDFRSTVLWISKYLPINVSDDVISWDLPMEVSMNWKAQKSCVYAAASLNKAESIIKEMLSLDKNDKIKRYFKYRNPLLYIDECIFTAVFRKRKDPLLNSGGALYDISTYNNIIRAAGELLNFKQWKKYIIGGKTFSCLMKHGMVDEAEFIFNTFIDKMKLSGQNTFIMEKGILFLFFNCGDAEFFNRSFSRFIEKGISVRCEEITFNDIINLDANAAKKAGRFDIIHLIFSMSFKSQGVNFLAPYNLTNLKKKEMRRVISIMSCAGVDDDIQKMYLSLIDNGQK